MANLDAALERTRSTAPSTTVQGRRFERMFRAALLNHPGEFRDKFARVWLWDDWPGRDGHRVHREAAGTARRASRVLSLELAAAVQEGVTG